MFPSFPPSVVCLFFLHNGGVLCSILLDVTDEQKAVQIRISEAPWLQGPWPPKATKLNPLEYS